MEGQVAVSDIVALILNDTGLQETYSFRAKFFSTVWFTRANLTVQTGLSGVQGCEPWL